MLSLFSANLFVLINVPGILGYNLKSSQVFKDPKEGQWMRDSYFGFSVAIHANPKDPAVLIGAPRANTSRFFGIKEPGCVYHCRLNGKCKEWPVNAINPDSRDIRQKLDSGWLGASISVQNEAQPRVIVCAPKWRNTITGNEHMNGICYYTFVDSSSAFERKADGLIRELTGPDFQLITQNRKTFYYYGMGQLGFSLHEYSDESTWNMMIGAPGTYIWKGTPVLISEDSRGLRNSIIPENLQDSMSLLGYSMTSGFFFDDNNRWNVASKPKMKDRGEITIFQYNKMDERMEYVKFVSGTQTGEFFGASVAACNVHGDDRDEIIVGAPLWSDNGDEGRIYVLSAEKNSKRFTMTTINGQFKDARFGATVMCLGDLDHDGYEDVAVAAPWEEKFGAVYIFNGGIHGLSSVASQKIKGKDFGRLKGFGLAISEPRDVDGNGYSDIVIGAYKSGRAVLFRARPVVNLQIYLSPVDLSRINSNTTTFSFRVCAYYDGFKVPETLRITKSFKIDETLHRANLGDRMKSINGTYQENGTLYYRVNNCDNIPIFLTGGTKSDPIEIFASLALIDDESSDLPPIINKQISKLENTMQLPFEVDCGPDNICHSNLTATIFTNLGMNNSYTIGSEKIIRLFLNVRNYGEPAYQTEAHVILPESIDLAIINSDCSQKHLTNGSSEVVCDLGSPLRNQTTLTLELDMSRVKSDSDFSESINISVNLTTRSENINVDTGIHNLTINLRVDADVIVIGKAVDSAYSYLNTSEDRLESIQFNHIYKVQRLGITPIQQAALTILIPTHLHKNEEKIEIARINSTDLKILNSINENNNNNCQIEEIAEDKMIEDNLSDFGSIEASSKDRALVLNCRNPKIDCINVTCILDVPMASGNSSTVAELKLTIDLQLKNFTDDLMDSKDMILFMTNGFAAITHPLSKNHEFNQKKTSIVTKFLGTPIAASVALWIIILSVFLGILLLAILIIVLIKLGFFNRKQKEELEALKAETDNNHGIVIETTSSTECLDRY